MRILSIVMLSLLWGFLTGCTSSSFVRTGNVFNPLPKGADVKIFATSKPENGSYQEIGILTVSGGDMEDRFEKAREKAREVGGNGIIVGQQVEKSSSMPVTQYHTATTSSGGMINYSTQGSQDSAWTEQQFTIIRLTK